MAGTGSMVTQVAWPVNLNRRPLRGATAAPRNICSLWYALWKDFVCVVAYSSIEGVCASISLQVEELGLEGVLEMFPQDGITRDGEHV